MNIDQEGGDDRSDERSERDDEENRDDEEKDEETRDEENRGDEENRDDEEKDEETRDDEGESFSDIYSRLNAAISLCRPDKISETVDQIIRGQTMRIDTWSEVVALLETLLSRSRHTQFSPIKEWFGGHFNFSDSSQEDRHLFYCSLVGLRVVFDFMSGVLESLKTDEQKIKKKLKVMKWNYHLEIWIGIV